MFDPEIKSYSAVVWKIVIYVQKRRPGHASTSKLIELRPQKMTGTLVAKTELITKATSNDCWVRYFHILGCHVGVKSSKASGESSVFEIVARPLKYIMFSRGETRG